MTLLELPIRYFMTSGFCTDLGKGEVWASVLMKARGMHNFELPLPFPFKLARHLHLMADQGPGTQLDSSSLRAVRCVSIINLLKYRTVALLAGSVCTVYIVLHHLTPSYTILHRLTPSTAHCQRQAQHEIQSYRGVKPKVVHQNQHDVT